MAAELLVIARWPLSEAVTGSVLPNVMLYIGLKCRTVRRDVDSQLKSWSGCMVLDSLTTLLSGTLACGLRG